MGLLDKFKGKPAAPSEAELAKQAARRRELDRDPAERIAGPTYVTALAEAGIPAEQVVGAVNGCLGTINTPGTGNLPDMRSVDIGVVVLTSASKIAYAIEVGDRVELVIRRADEVAQLRRSNTGGSVWIVFENDRCFPDRGGRMSQADNWEFSTRNQDAVRSVFLDAGYHV